MYLPHKEEEEEEEEDKKHWKSVPSTLGDCPRATLAVSRFRSPAPSTVSLFLTIRVLLPRRRRRLVARGAHRSFAL